jgi:zinc transporter
LRMWAAEDVLITLRARPVRSATDVRKLVEAGDIDTSTGALVAGIADRLTDRMETVLDDFDDEADRYEDELLDPKTHIDRSVLPEFRRRVLQVRRHIMPQREALSTLVRGWRTVRPVQRTGPALPARIRRPDHAAHGTGRKHPGTIHRPV